MFECMNYFISKIFFLFLKQNAISQIENFISLIYYIRTTRKKKQFLMQRIRHSSTINSILSFHVMSNSSTVFIFNRNRSNFQQGFSKLVFKSNMTATKRIAQKNLHKIVHRTTQRGTLSFQNRRKNEHTHDLKSLKKCYLNTMNCSGK